MGNTKLRLGSLLLALALVSSACGARLTDQQKTALRSPRSAAAPSAGDASQPAADVATTTPSEVFGSGSGGGTATTVGGGSQAATVDPTKLPPGGNGGATDVGVTASTITIGNVSTLTGPVPGLFAGAAVGTQAVFAYQNSLGGLYGRKFRVDVRDDQFDSGENRTQTLDLLGKAFAFDGSFSLYDDAAVDQIKQSNIPDMTATISLARTQLPNNFALQPLIPGAPTGPFNYFKARNPDVITKVGTIYANIPSAVQAYKGFRAAAYSVGYKFIYERAFGATETDFTSDIVRMRNSGVKMVYILAADDKTTARIAEAMASQNFKPEVFAAGVFAYDADVIALAGSTAEGMFVTMSNAMYGGEDAASIPEVALFDKWVQNVKPGYVPDLYAADGWAEGRLLIQAMTNVGPKLTRVAVDDAVRKIGVFDDHGLFPPSNSGTKTPTPCYIVLKVTGGKYMRYDSPPTGYRCDDSTYFKTG